MGMNRKIKVLIVVYRLKIAGAENVALSLAKGLNKEKYEPIICCLKDNKIGKELQDYNIRVFNLNKIGRFDFTVLFKLLKLIKKEKVDIIHTHSFSPNLWGRLAAIIGRVPVIISTEHTVATVKTNLHKIIDKILAKFTTKIISVSMVVRNSILEEENISPDKILTIYNGIDIKSLSVNKEDMKKKSGSLGIDLSKPVVVSVGRLEPPKGHIHLLEAAKIVTKEFKSVQFLIIGDGYLKPQLEKMAANLGITNNIIFAGFRSDIADILSLADIAVMSSVREGFSIALLEYMASGKPIVVTDVGGNKEAIENGVSGLIVPACDTKALGEAILYLLKNKDIALELGRKAKRKLEAEFTLTNMVNKIQQLYDECRNRRKYARFFWWDRL